MAVKRLLAVMALSVSAAFLFAAPAELRVKGDRVNLRARPIGDSEVAGQVSTGDILIAPEGFEPGAEWVKVRPPASVDVWIYASLLTGDEVNASDCLVRCGPGLNYKYVGKFDKGDKIVRRGPTVGDWQPIAPIANKCELFISSEYVEAVVKAEGGVRKSELSPVTAKTPEPVPAPVAAVTTTRDLTPASSAESGVRSAELSPAAAKAPVPAPAPAPIPVAKPEPPVSAPAETSKLPNLETSKPPVAAVAPVAKPQPQSQPFNPSTLQPSNVEPGTSNVERQTSNVKPVTSNQEPATSKLPNLETSKPPKLPSELSNLALDKFQPQGVPSVYSGRLEKVPSMRAAGSTRYQLVAKTGVMKSAVVCRLSGLSGQWRELLDSDLEVTGHIWYLSGDPVPVLHASRVIRVASWEE